MKTRILSLLVILALAVVSCQKDEANKPVVLQDVTFGIEHVDPFGLKSDTFDIECRTDLTPVKAKIKIGGIYYEPLVFFLNDRWYTQAIKLAPATYTIEEFYLIDANDSIVMATPAAGSHYAPFVDNKTVAQTIVVDAFVKKEFKMWVLCYEEAHYDEFGFFWFRLNRIVVRTFCFFGDICANGEPYLPGDFEGTAYDNVPGGTQFDMPAIFQIHAFDSDDDPLPYSPFSNLGSENLPLCVEYPDNIDIAGETFTFELWIMGPDGTYTHYHTFTVTDDQIDITDVDDDGVIEFVVGNCNYSPTDLQLAWPITPDIVPGFISGLTKKAEVRWRNFRSNHNGWDWAVGASIPGQMTVVDWYTGAVDWYWTPGYNTVEFGYDGSTKVWAKALANGTGTDYAEFITGDLGVVDYMQFYIQAVDGQTVKLFDVELTVGTETYNLPNLEVIGTPGSNWHIPNFDISAGFVLTGKFEISGVEAGGDEWAKINISIREM